MKKLNKKGYVLVETLIVTVFVVTLFMLVFQATVPTIGEYERLYIYDDIDSVYASNLYKQMLTHYGNIAYIDELLNTSSNVKHYVDVTDCDNTNIYMNPDYCKQIKKSLSILEDDKIIITNYNLAAFRLVVNSDEFFDSGNLSNFRNYMKTIPDVENLSDINKYGFDYNGKYRIFISRTIKEADDTTSRRYVNIGVYTGNYEKYLMGERVKFNPDGNGDRYFYVLKNSPSTDEFITLILAENLPNSNVCFTDNNTQYMQESSENEPNTLLAALKEQTSTWTNAILYNGYSYIADAGYIINYNGYRARLLEENDILEVLGCKKYGNLCFSPDEAFEVGNGTNSLGFLSNGLTGINGYWTAIALPNSGIYAWSIQDNKVKPTLISDCTSVDTNTIGIRPIIRARKSDISR